MISLLEIALLAIPILAAVGWWHLLQTVVDRQVRALLTAFWVLVQFIVPISIIGWLGLLSPWLVLSIEVVLTGALWVWALSRPAKGTPTQPPFSVVERVTIAVTSSAAALLVLRAIWYAVLMPLDGSDGSTYHVPAMIDAMRNGSFEPSQSVVPPGQAGPKSVDMLFLWLLQGKDLDLVLFGQLMFVPLAVFSVVVIARWAGVRPPVAWAAGPLILFVPIVVAQLSSAYVDVGSGALLLAAIALTLTYRQGILNGPVGAVSVYASIGLAAGSKFSLVIPAVVLLVMVVSHDMGRRTWGWGHVAGVAIGLIGAGWYIESLIRFGNPAWPYSVPGLAQVFPHLDTVDALVARELSSVPELVETSPILRPLLVWLERGKTAFMYTFDSRLAGLGPMWPAIWLPVYLAWLAWSVKEKTWRKPLLLGGLTVAFVAVQTYPWWTRFVWWMVVIGIVAVALLWQKSSSLTRGALGALLIAGGLYVLAMTSVQGLLIRENFVPLLNGANPVEIEAGPVVSAAYPTAGERIAVPALSWGSWNTYLRGSTFDNEVVVVSPQGGNLETRLRAVGATMVFVPGMGPTWSESELAEATSCMEEVKSDVGRRQTLFRYVCP
ncbi:MAG: hypothetical protein WBM90_01690 [Acidimicrobiia bacterium]